MPRNSSTVPAVMPRTAPSPVHTTGAPPQPAWAAAAPAVATVAPVAVRVNAVSAAQHAAASEARRQWVVFMILTPSVSEVAGRTGRPPADAPRIRPRARVGCRRPSPGRATERLVKGVAAGLVTDPAPGVEPGLHGDLGDAAQLVQAHQLPGHQDLRMAGEAEIRTADQGAGGCGHGSPQPFVLVSSCLSTGYADRPGWARHPTNGGVQAASVLATTAGSRAL